MDSPSFSFLASKLDFEESPMTSLSSGLRDLSTSPVQKLSFCDPDVEDDSSRDSGICMDGESAVSPAPLPRSSFRDLFADTLSPSCRRTRRRPCADGAASPQFPKFQLSPDQHCRKTSGLKRKVVGNCMSGEKKSKIDHTDAQRLAKVAIEQQEAEDNLVGDCTKSHRLPTIKGPQQNLKYITPATMVDLITGRISVGPNTDYKIIDCRYPYEFDGGHIPGALNLHTQEKLNEMVKEFHEQPENKDTVLIFHCEFSSERGPKRAKFVRNLDRQLNAEKYPFLNFPEVYVMKGGYKDFYDQYSQLCVPRCYVPMLHEEHRSDLKKFRSKSKSWSGENKSSSLRNRFNVAKLMLEY